MDKNTINEILCRIEPELKITTASLIIILGLRVLNGLISNPKIEDYVTANIESAKARVYETTCISIPFDAPVVYQPPQTPGLQEKLQLFFSLTLGAYYPHNNTIYLNSTSLTTDELTLRNLLGWSAHFEINSDALHVLVHEETHAYLENIVRQEAALGDKFPDPIQAFDDYLGRKLIREGVAEYFQNKYLGENLAEDPRWYDQARRMHEAGRITNKYRIYEIGLSLVTPIIDAYGEEGIRYLAANPPRGEELADLRKYQQDAFYAISEYAPFSFCGAGK